MGSIRIWLEATRPKTLSAAVCPVLVGASLASYSGRFDFGLTIICLFFALLVQIGTNFANDYLDGVKGTDTKDRIGPRRAVANGLIGAECMKRAALAVLAIAFCLGLMLIPYGGWWLLLVGMSSVLCAWLYTGGPYPLAYNGLGDVFVVLFFGFVAVGCTYYVQAGALDGKVLWASLACGLLINNILVVNNYRDRDEDKLASKRTLIVLLGRQFGRLQYLGSLLVVSAVTCYLTWATAQWAVLLTVVPLAISLYVSIRLKHLSGGKDFQLALQLSGISVGLYGFLFSLGLLL